MFVFDGQNKTNLRDHLREFNGFEFDRNSDEYQRHLSSLTKYKNHLFGGELFVHGTLFRLKKDQLQSLSDLLGLPSSASNQEQAEALLNFLFEPIDEGKVIPGQKMSMRNSTKSRESVRIDDDEEDEDLEVIDQSNFFSPNRLCCLF